jgi:lipid A 4'-phosphatase
MIKKNLLYITIILLSLIVIILFLYPSLDIKFSKLFYYCFEFKYHNSFIAKFTFNIIYIIVAIIIFSLFSILIWHSIKYQTIKNLICIQVLYLLFTLSLGPGILVNGILKTQIGRARPINIVEFGGNKIFSKVAINAYECDGDCSFPSGHASTAYYLTIFAYIFPKYFISLYCSGLLFGSMIGILLSN